MNLAFRAEVLKAAIEDAETRMKLDLAVTWEECCVVLQDFAKKHGFKVLIK